MSFQAMSWEPRNENPTGLTGNALGGIVDESRVMTWSAKGFDMTTNREPLCLGSRTGPRPSFADLCPLGLISRAPSPKGF